ncbi:unnamed protein product [Pleuronectes platessa]|uniref:Uncharacterized protein n=1 Tax=Pleuronectes platessa TaxID=8262 RepID=A0A9N7V1X0_PLEPL|nr:unnamed protein product [Pleuronectes platessa]
MTETTRSSCSASVRLRVLGSSAAQAAVSSACEPSVPSALGQRRIGLFSRNINLQSRNKRSSLNPAVILGIQDADVFCPISSVMIGYAIISSRWNRMNLISCLLDDGSSSSTSCRGSYRWSRAGRSRHTLSREEAVPEENNTFGPWQQHN